MSDPYVPSQRTGSLALFFADRAFKTRCSDDDSFSCRPNFARIICTSVAEYLLFGLADFNFFVVTEGGGVIGSISYCTFKLSTKALVIIEIASDLARAEPSTRCFSNSNKQLGTMRASCCSSSAVNDNVISTVIWAYPLVSCIIRIVGISKRSKYFDVAFIVPFLSFEFVDAVEFAFEFCSCSCLYFCGDNEVKVEIREVHFAFIANLTPESVTLWAFDFVWNFTKSPIPNI